MRVPLLALCVFLAGCSQPAQPPTPASPPAQVSLDETWETSYLVDPATGFGKITATSTPEQLAQAYGPQALVLQEVHLGEGETAPGGVLFESDPSARVELVWSSPERDGVASASVQGEESQWSTPQGITLGTTLAELEKINTVPFTLTGFGWDYGGTVISWEGGKLESLGPVRLRLGVDRKREIPEQLLGDQGISSAAPGLSDLEPRVTGIIMTFQTTRSQ